jgi:hypothetical protein
MINIQKVCPEPTQKNLNKHLLFFVVIIKFIFF